LDKKLKLTDTSKVFVTQGLLNSSFFKQDCKLFNFAQFFIIFSFIYFILRQKKKFGLERATKFQGNVIGLLEAFDKRLN